MGLFNKLPTSEKVKSKGLLVTKRQREWNQLAKEKNGHIMKNWKPSYIKVEIGPKFEEVRDA